MQLFSSTALLLLFLASPALAQRPDPNQDRIPQPLPNPEDALPAETDDPITPAPAPPAVKTPDGQTTLSVTQIDIIGSTVFTPTDFEPLVTPLEGRDVSINELQALTEAITQLYFDQGYLTSRAVLSEQEITDGTVQIQVIEGTISDIRIEGNTQTKTGYLKKRLALGTSTPAQLGAIEDQLRLLQLDPLFETVNGTLAPGENAGESILSVVVKESKPFNFDVSVDNYSPPSVGGVRTGVGVSYRNATGWGDQLSLSYSRSTTGGSNLYDVGYRIPLNAKDGTLQLRALITDSSQTQTTLDFDGNSEFYEISFRQPLIRNPREEFALSLAFAYRDGQTFLFNSPFPFGIGPDANGISRTSVFKFGQDYIKRDSTGAWALQSQFSLGTGLFNATNNTGAIPDGQFFSWLGQAQRVQRLGKNNLLIMQGSAQFSPDSLLASEQFVIGGGQSVRGFRQNVRSGDNGLRFSIEDRITLVRNKKESPVIQIAPFLDLGYVFNSNNNPNLIFGEQFLISSGLGLLLEPVSGLNIRLDYAVPFVDLSDRGNNVQDEGFHFSVRYSY
ncbi:ShlB/FhaC/HecB family hemolysin secretion/activation protein [Acaryochloris marina]|uniref:Polypeptide-transport-associated, ShlB-type n=1 Tax=Acaryochloris marina (strain MBIC 11017) TaxID=329726 RepID=B0CFV8_ACAM1|nr:ShlB/FhaC/HecB family hemolysin secretion/activation protein [Acaryochloris marina]ABW28262.1 polypeptide-transport-associated, ShlB-type [Acaryochloris marina MBIC11017]